MTKIILISGKEKKIINFYPNVFKDEIKTIIGTVKNGDVVDVCSSDMAFVGRGYVTDSTSAYVRILTTKDEKIDKNFILEKIRKAYKKREHLFNETNCIRAFFSEGDGIPGLIIDKFDKYVSVQFRNSGVETFRQDIINSIKKVMKPKGIYERSDVENRTLEGVEQKTGIVFGEIPERVIMEDNGLKYSIDIIEGQKTGFFLDQKENRAAIHRICKNKDVLDCFIHTGSFALNAGIAGAKSVLGIDVSQHAVDCATRNAMLNNLQNTVKFECHNAFDVLGEWSRNGKEFDVVILDPPAFTKSKNTIKQAIRGYKEINLRGLKMVKKGGYFATCSCSHYMSEEQLKKTVLEAAHDARRTLRQIEVRTQSSDHPILWNSDESYYLKFFIFQVI